jgi:uncharacterized membrane protein YraQ (UPF0718 family)
VGARRATDGPTGSQGRDARHIFTHMTLVRALGHALWTASTMSWEILWPLILGFTISAIVQAVVPTRQIARMLGNDHPTTLAKACALGAASSSCSYAAVAIARSLFRKGANFTAAMVFELASTNLVVELSIVMIVLLGWRFALAEFVGAPVMVLMLALLFRRFLTRGLEDEARVHADRGIPGRMEGHAAMHMEVTDGGLWQRLSSDKGRTAISHYFVMDWVAVWPDVVGGLLIAGALAAWVPGAWWAKVSMADSGRWSAVWGVLIGPVIAVLSFVCSVGNIPLAAVIWNGGISFGGVVAFIFADLIVLPILDIYRKYYGWRVMWFILGTFYTSMVVSAFAIDVFFRAAGVAPVGRIATVAEATIRFNYTTVLNLVFLGVAALLVRRFLMTGGPAMLKSMHGPGAGGGPHDHGHAGHGHAA